MYGPVRKTDTEESMVYVNVTLVSYIEPGRKQRAKFDKGSDWPTSWIHFSGEQIDKGLHVFGMPEQILTSWFGQGERRDEPAKGGPGPAPDGRRIVVPGIAVPPGFDPKRGGS